LTPAVFLSFQPLRVFTLRAYYKKSFRMPTFNDLYYTDVGNIALEPEYATQYNVGLHYQQDFSRRWLKRIETKVDAYYNRVDNKIVAIPKGSGQYRWMMMNIGKAKIRGIDVSAQTMWMPLRDWTLNLTVNYTYQKAQDYSDPADNDPVAGTWGGQIAYIPWHSGSVLANLAYKDWGLNYSFIYVGERYHNSSNIRANHEEPWYTHDLSLTKDFRIGSLRNPKSEIRNPKSEKPYNRTTAKPHNRTTVLTVQLECNNLLNQQYDIILNYPMPGRNWKCVLKYSF
jgi:outer membrane cobalamin receptor